MTRLTLCVATVPSRTSLLSRLLWTLEPQLRGDVEVLVHADPMKPLGVKSNEMWREASGDYVARIDDDDLVSSDYVTQIMARLATGHDYVGFTALYTVDGQYVGEYEHDWEHGSNEHWSMVRAVSPIMVVPTSVALKYAHGNERESDFEWSDRVHNGYQPLKPASIKRVLYHYDSWPEHSLPNTPDGVKRKQRDVGTWPYTPSKFKMMGASNG